jgi:hypothetical protein
LVVFYASELAADPSGFSLARTRSTAGGPEKWLGLVLFVMVMFGRLNSLTSIAAR